MARYTDPVCRLCRQVSEKLFLKGERCYTPKCAVERRRRPPGGVLPRRRRNSEWGVRLREKQKMRYSYGVLERQFRRYFDEALRNPGVTGQTLAQLMERRLDNVVYRLGFAESRRQARQLVNHGHITVNNRKMGIPSFIVKAGDTVAWREISQSKEFAKALTDGIPVRPVPSWLALNPGNLTGQVLSLPDPQELEVRLDTRLIVEHYSR